MTPTSHRTEERVDRFVRPAHMVARSVGAVSACARTCVALATGLGTWVSRRLARPSRSAELAARQFASFVARPVKRLWRRPLHERVMAICGCIAAIAFVATLFTSLTEHDAGLVSATGTAAAEAIGFLLFGLFFLALGNLPRATRWISHVLEVASVELHRERRTRQITGHDGALTSDAGATPSDRLEVIVIDSSIPVPDPWHIHRILRRGAAVAIDSIPDGTQFAVLAARDGDVRALYPTDGTLASASSASRRDAAVHLRLLWPSGELDLDRALRSVRDLVTLAGRTSPHLTVVMSGTHDATEAIDRTVARLRGQFTCDVVAFGSGGSAASTVASALDGRVVRLEDGDEIAAVCAGVGGGAADGWASPTNVVAQP